VLVKMYWGLEEVSLSCRVECNSDMWIRLKIIYFLWSLLWRPSSIPIETFCFGYHFSHLQTFHFRSTINSLTDTDDFRKVFGRQKSEPNLVLRREELNFHFLSIVLKHSAPNTVRNRGLTALLTCLAKLSVLTLCLICFRPFNSRPQLIYPDGTRLNYLHSP
jgi:hypothetical protein